MKNNLILFILLSINLSSYGQINPVLSQWERVYQPSSPFTNMSKNGSILYTFNNITRNYYESRDSGKTWIVKILNGDAPVFQYEDFILANGGRTLQQGSGTQSTISESWVSASRGNLSFRNLGFTGSNCGWHSGICQSWGGYKICDSVATYAYIESGYRVTDPYTDRYYIDVAGNQIRSVPNFYKMTAFTYNYNVIGFQNGKAIGTQGNAIVVENDTTFHLMPSPDIPNLKIAFASNKCFVFKTNGIVWTSTNWGNWSSQNIPLSNVSEVEHTHGFFMIKTSKGFFKALPADTLVWLPIYQNGVNGSDELTKITVFNNLLVGFANDKLYRSFNGGTSWDVITTQGIDNQATHIQISLNRDSVKLSFDTKILSIDTLGRLTRLSDLSYFSSTNVPDTARKGQFIAVNTTSSFSFSKDTGQTWISTQQAVFKNIFFLGDYLYGVNLNGIWRIKPKDLVCFPYEKSISAALDCYQPYFFERELLTRPGDYIKPYRTINGCDSIIKLHLETPYYSNLNDYKKVTICNNVEYFFGGIRIFNSGRYTKWDTLPSGCSVYRTLDIQFVDKFLFGTEITVNEGDTVRNIRMGARDTIFQTIFTSVGGCDSIYQLYVHVRPLPTATLDVEEEALIVFPNPTHASFEIKSNLVFDNAATITIFDAKGAVIRHGNLNTSSRTIDTEGWQLGVFWIKITTHKGVYVRKVVKY